MDTLYMIILGVSALIITGLLYVVLFPKKNFVTPHNDDDAQEAVEENDNVAINNRGGRGGLARMNLRNRNRQQQQQQQQQAAVVEQQQQRQQQNNNNQAADSDDEDIDDLDDIDDIVANGGIDPKTGKKMGTKKLEKLRKKEERRKQREYEEHMRAERKKAEEEKDEELRLRKLEELEKERLRIEEETRIRLEKEKKEDEEYQAMKNAFTLDESGESKQNEEDEKNLLQQFIQYLETNKICLLEDISMEFGMKTNDVIDRIKTLDKEGLISGVIDDRGKFINVSREDMESVAKFINKKGRVTIEQIAHESNKLIDLTPKPKPIEETPASQPTESVA